MKITDQPDFTKIERETRKQLARTISSAITDTVTELRVHTKEVFDIRTKWVDSPAVGVNGTRSIDPIKLEGSIFTRAPWIIDHEEGKTRNPKGRNFAVPTNILLREVGKKNLIPKNMKPKQLLKNTGLKKLKRHKAAQSTATQYFKVILRKSGLESIVRRKGGQLGIEPLYIFKPVAHIKAEYNFYKFGIELFKKNFDRIADRLLSKV